VNYIRDLTQISRFDVAVVGGKTASLGEMIQSLTAVGVRVPGGFAITADAYRYLLQHNDITAKITQLVAAINYSDQASIAAAGKTIRALIEKAALPEDLKQQIKEAYHQLSARFGKEPCSVAVRSSATAEDLPTASFAGQQETFLCIVGDEALYAAILGCFASLFTDRALLYRHEQGFADTAVALSICVQKMVRADVGVAGVLFTLDTETGFDQVVTINAAYGLGEAIVQGAVTPDEYVVYKKKLTDNGLYPLIKKKLGNKSVATRLENGKVVLVAVPVVDQKKFTLDDARLQELVDYALAIEQHYGMPMDIEWALDGVDQLLYIVQARPETVHTIKGGELIRYQLAATQQQPLITGQSIGQKIAQGKVRVIVRKQDLTMLLPGEVLVTTMTDPDWVPLLKSAAAIITDIGGRTCHAAIVSRELGIPALVGTGNGTSVLRDGQEITFDGSQGGTGVVYEGLIDFSKEIIPVKPVANLPFDLLVNVADPDRAFAVCQLPIKGVGLARLEFIINHTIGVHPMAAANPEMVKDSAVRQQLFDKAAGYACPAEFFVETLAQGVGMIAAALYPRPVIVRLSDFKSNEYRTLLGGADFEPHEENPMLGWRGAARYISPAYKPAFELECAALKRARNEMGFSNIRFMVPFVRTVGEAAKVVATLASQGIVRGQDGLELYMMVEIPSNVLLLEQFAPYFDGFSIGSNDLTQLTLGIDRDSGSMLHAFDERDPAVKLLLGMAIEKARALGKPIGICGQAPSDYPELANFLVDAGITSISLTPDAVMPFLNQWPT